MYALKKERRRERERERERKEENILLDDITIFLIESEQPGGILGILWNEEYEIQVGIKRRRRKGRRNVLATRSGREFLIYFVVGGDSDIAATEHFNREARETASSKKARTGF